MKIDASIVGRLAGLSFLSLSDDELAKLTDDLGKTAKLIEKLEELDTSGVEPTFRMTDLTNVWREDVVEPQLPREELLKLAPERTDTAVKVPRVLG